MPRAHRANRHDVRHEKFLHGVQLLRLLDVFLRRGSCPDDPAMPIQ